MRVEFSSLRTDRIRRVHQRIAAQPNWVVRAALMTFALIIVLPILLLVLVAFTLAVVVFAVLGLINRIGNLITGRSGTLWGRDSRGRRNVTVLPRES